MASFRFAVVIPDQQLASMRESLDPKQYRSATFQAVDRTTTAAVKIVKEEIKKHAFIKPKYVNRVIKGTRPKGDPPVGTVRISQEDLPAIAFKVSGGKRSGITIQYTQDGSPITLRHAFRATVRSAQQAARGLAGHQGIFLRTKHLPTKGPNQDKGKLTPRGFAGRLAIREQMGPSVLKIVELPKVFEPVASQVEGILAKNVQSQLDRFLKPNFGGA